MSVLIKYITLIYMELDDLVTKELKEIRHPYWTRRICFEQIKTKDLLYMTWFPTTLFIPHMLRHGCQYSRYAILNNKKSLHTHTYTITILHAEKLLYTNYQSLISHFNWKMNKKTMVIVRETNYWKKNEQKYLYSANLQTIFDILFRRYFLVSKIFSYIFAYR